MKILKNFLACVLSLTLLATLLAATGCGGQGCDHQWSEATCTKPKTCSLCNETEGEALGHTPNEDDGDCTTAVTCSVCDEIITEAKENHVGGAATCNHKAHCSVCDKEYGELAEHTWSCDSATEEQDKHCTVCGYVAEEKLIHTHADKLTHVEAKSPTCTEAGNVEYWICACGKWFSDSSAATEITNHESVVLSATNHAHSSEWSQSATQHWRECVCEDKTALSEHTWNYESATEEHDKHCIVCNYVAEEQINHVHTFESEITYDDGGHYYASTCGHEVKKDYTPHQYESEDTPETCIEQGYTTYTCPCGKTYKDNYVDPRNHSFDESEWKYDGGGHWYESTCGHEVKKDYASHQYQSVVTPPSCTERGYTTYTCGECGYSYVGDYVAEKGHTVNNWVESDSMLTDDSHCGYTVYFTGSCSVCYEPQEKEEYFERHTWTYVVKEGYEADCQNGGKKLQFCKNEGCLYQVTPNEIPYSDPNAHIWVEDETQSISGMTSYHCSVKYCNATKNILSASGNSASVSSDNVGNLDEIALENATIGFDQGVKDKLNESGSDVEISAGTLDGEDRDNAINQANLTPEQKALLGNKKIYDFTVTTTENVSDLGGTATIRIPYTLLEGEDPDNVIVWYISNEMLTAVKATYADGYVTFTTTHFSYYLATTIEPSLLCEYLGEHDTENVHIVLPTCTEGGYTVCIRCGKIVEGSETSPLGHSWHTTVISEEDCTTSGLTRYECTVCDAEYEATVGATGHYYVQKAQTSPTCKLAGSVTYGCIYCNSEYEVTLPQLGHTYAISVKAPTCEENGYTQKTCLTCGDTLYTDYQNATGHSYGTAWQKNPDGHYHICTSCGKSGELSKHTPGAAATEQSAQICTVCEYIISPPLLHKHSLTLVEARAATCLENGNIAYYICECGKWFLDANGEQLIADHSAVIVLAKGHTHVSIPHVEPTCTEVGYTAGIKCSVCDTVIRGHVELNPYGHDYITVESAPTCTEDGVISRVCSICQDRLADESIPKLEHKYVIKKIVAPNCTVDGYTEYICLYCSDEYEGDVKAAYGHSYSTEWSVDENSHWHECKSCGDKSDVAEHIPGAEATESSPQICLACNYVIEPIKNHTHSPAEAIASKEPTCESMGNLGYYICSCGNWYYDEACENEITDRKSVVLKALGHDITYIEEIHATCTEGGCSGGYYCSACERIVSGCEPLLPLGHDYREGVCVRCEDEDPNYVPIFDKNTIEISQALNSNGTIKVVIKVRNADLAGIRFRLNYGEYRFNNANCYETSQYFDTGSAVNFVFSSGINRIEDELSLITLQFATPTEAVESLTLEIIEIYRFSDADELEIPDYEIIYNM